MGENESRFRLVNERLRDLVIDDAERHGEHAELLSVLCECGDVDCTAKIDVAARDVRVDPLRVGTLRDRARATSWPTPSASSATAAAT